MHRPLLTPAPIDMTLPHSYNTSGAPTRIEAAPRRRQTPNQPPNLLTTSLGNARNAILGVGGGVQTPISSTTLSSPFSAYPHSAYPQSPAGAMREASPMASRSASGFSGHYNPQQWRAVNNRSPNSMSMAGEHRQTSHSSRMAHLAPTGPDEPVASPPPPYSPRRDQRAQNSPRRTSDIISPADTTSPDTEYSRYGTPVSAATTLSPDFVSRLPGGPSPSLRQHTSPSESPNPVSPPSFPPPPGQRIRAGSKNHADRLLSSLTLRGKSSKASLTIDAVDTLQDPPAQALPQVPSSRYNDPTTYPPAARRAASTGGIGLAGGSSRSAGHSPSPVTWEPSMPLPPPPPGPPPSVRSQSLNRPVESPSSGIAPPTMPFRSRRPPGTGTSLDTIPPTPADWREGATDDRAPSRERSHGQLHIDTGNISRSGTDYLMTATGSAHPRRDSSAGGYLYRSPAVRNRSAMGIRERRSESRNGKGRAVEDLAVEHSCSVAPWEDDFQDVRPMNLILSGSQINARMTTPKSGRSMQSLNSALNSPKIQMSSGKAVSSISSNDTAQPESSRSVKSVLERPTSAIASPILPLKANQIPPRKRLSGPPKALSLIVPSEPEQRPLSHLLHAPISDDSIQIPLTPANKAAQESLEDLLGPESPKLFAGRAIERHRIFAEREAAAANDSERLDLFCQYIKAESRIRREQYASVFEEDVIEVGELTQGLFGSDKAIHDRQQSQSRQDVSTRTSIASSALGDSSSQKYPSSATTNSSTQQRPDWNDYVPCLSPIAASMSVVTGQEEWESRGRSGSRWFDQSHAGDGPTGDGFKVLERSKRESKYMGVPREARNSPQLYSNPAARGQSSGASGQPSYGAGQYPNEKTGLQESPPSFFPPTPSSAPFTPDPRKVDMSRLITLPPPFPRHYPAVNNAHPDLADSRAVVRSLHEKEEAESVTESYRVQILEKRQRADSWCKHQRLLHRQFQIEHGNISQDELQDAQVDPGEKIANSEKKVAQIDFDLYQRLVLTPLHALFSDRIKLADTSLHMLSSRLFSNQSPDLPQEEGDERPELLEVLTQLKWLFEARETLHRQIYDLLSARNDRYKKIVLLPYKQSQNDDKHAEAEQFFAEDAQERGFKFQQAVCERAQAFLSIIEINVSRGVEVHLAAFWEIGPELMSILHKVPSRLDRFEFQIPADEYAENPSLHNHPLQYLYSLLGHAEKSTYQFIESQINLLCLLHEIRSHALAARCKVEAQGRDASWAAEEKQRREETRLTEDLKEKVGVVESQWEEALGSELVETRERVREFLLEQGGWDDEGD